MLGEEEGRGGMPSVLHPQPAPHPMVPGRTAPPESHGPSRNLLPRLLPRGRGVCLLPGAQVPALALAAAMLHIQSFLPWLLLLTMPMCTHAWSRPMWYQVGLDLQPWGCQPSSLEGCESSLGCPGYWMGLGTNRIYPVAGVTVTTTMMLMLSRALMQRRRSQASKSEVSQAPSPPPFSSVLPIPPLMSPAAPPSSLPPQGPYVCPQPTVPGHFLWVVPYPILPLAISHGGGYLSRLPPVISLALTQPAWGPRPHEATSVAP